MRSDEQKLIDITYQIAFCSAQFMHNKSNEEIAEWVSKQLRDCGFNTEPMGASWGVLTDRRNDEQTDSALR